MTGFPLHPESASTISPRIDAVYFALIGVGGGTATLIAILLIYFAVRYRRGADVNREPMSGRSGAMLEVSWIAVPFVAFMGVFVWSAVVFFDVTRAPDDAMDIYIVGKQWMWKAQHQSGRREINELHVPRGVNVRLVITSQDVIHSYFIPAFRVKKDAVPGRYTFAWFNATKLGTFHLFCAEYCGAEHSLMGGRIVVMEPADYQRWLSPTPTTEAVAVERAAAEPPMQVRGRELFESAGCTACHVLGSRVRAPRLDALFGTEVRLDNGQIVMADENYIRESILFPNAKIVAGYPAPSLMPAYQGQLNEEELVDLIEYLKSLGRATFPTPGEGDGTPTGQQDDDSGVQQDGGDGAP